MTVGGSALLTTSSPVPAQPTPGVPALRSRHVNMATTPRSCAMVPWTAAWEGLVLWIFFFVAVETQDPARMECERVCVRVRERRLPARVRRCVAPCGGLLKGKFRSGVSFCIDAPMRRIRRFFRAMSRARQVVQSVQLQPTLYGTSSACAAIYMRGLAARPAVRTFLRTQC